MTSKEVGKVEFEMESRSFLSEEGALAKRSLPSFPVTNHHHPLKRSGGECEPNN